MHQHRILIVDDHPANLAILEEILGDQYTLQTATCGEEALALASDFQPDLILLDIMMPGLDGYETCRRLRAHPTLRHTKIIMVSAKAMLSERLQGYEVGADDYLTKPFEEEELVAKVRVYLRLKAVEEVDALKTHVLSFLNHKTRTPLNGIIGPLQWLVEEEDLDAAERTRFLRMAQDSSQQLFHFLERSLTLSRMKVGQWAFEFHTEDLCALLRAAIDAVTAGAAERRVQIVPALLTPAPVRLDLDQMQEVITVLLDNAIRFSPVEGCVVVGVSAHEHGYCLTVRDQGVGIPPDRLPYVFQGFPPADVWHHTEEQGLSLALAQQIVLAHHGTIQVASTPGVETTFTVRLPAAGAAKSGHTT
jgi:signal transduction histidine kinase